MVSYTYKLQQINNNSAATIWSVSTGERYELQHVQCMATGGRTTRQRPYYKPWATSVTARTVGLPTYGSMPKPGSTYGRSGNLAATTLAETETGPKVILEEVSAP